MGDVTFGVKVSEEMKNELSQLMKEHALSGKEFMSMLIASYRLDKAKDETQLFQGDIIELQNLTKRIQGIFLNMTEKSKLTYKEEQEALEKVIATQQEEKEELVNQLSKLKEDLKEAKIKENDAQKREELLREKITAAHKEVGVLKNQLSNNSLLHQKFEEEVIQLKEQVKEYKRLDVEIQERNAENTKLKTRNDEIASEIWFLQREVEKLQKEKEQLIERYEAEKKNESQQYELKLKNELLNQQIELTLKNSELKEELMLLKEEKNNSERQYHQKIEELYQQLATRGEKK